MGRINHTDFVRLAQKNEQKILSGKSIKDIREAMEFFRSPDIQGLSKSSKQALRLAKERVSRALGAMGLSLEQELPQDPVLKNKIWKEQVAPMQKALREIYRYENHSIELRLPENATKKEVDDLLAEIKKIKLEQHQKKIRAYQEESILKGRIEAKKNELRRQRLGLDAEADPELAEKLFKSAEQGLQAERSNSAGYLYFKVWVMPDKSKWYKIGITNDLRRRDAEQNVLPVPPTTLHSVRFFSTDHARIVEKIFLETLSSSRIEGASNRELFSLKPSQVQAIIGAMKAIKSCTF